MYTLDTFHISKMILNFSLYTVREKVAMIFGQVRLLAGVKKGKVKPEMYCYKELEIQGWLTQKSQP